MKFSVVIGSLFLLTSSLSFGQSVDWAQVWSQTSDESKEELIRTCMLAFDMTASLYHDSAAAFEKQFPTDGAAMVQATEDWFHSLNAYRRGTSAGDFVGFAVATMDHYYADPKNAPYPFTDALAVSMLAWQKRQTTSP